MGQPAVVKDDRYGSSGRKPAKVWQGDIKSFAVRGLFSHSVDDDSLALARGQYGKAHAVFAEDLKCSGVDRRLRKPHAFGPSFETVFKILDAPYRLGFFVLCRGERHYHVAVALGNGLPARLPEGQVEDRVFLFDPSVQGWSEVEAQV